MTPTRISHVILWCDCDEIQRGLEYIKELVASITMTTKRDHTVMVHHNIFDRETVTLDNCPRMIFSTSSFAKKVEHPEWIRLYVPEKPSTPLSHPGVEVETDYSIADMGSFIIYASWHGEPQTADEEHTWKLAAQMLDDLKHNVFPGLMEDCPDDNGADIFKPISSNEVSDDLVNVKNTTDVPMFVVKDGELASKE